MTTTPITAPVLIKLIKSPYPKVNNCLDDSLMRKKIVN